MREERDGRVFGKDERRDGRGEEGWIGKDREGGRSGSVCRAVGGSRGLDDAQSGHQVPTEKGDGSPPRTWVAKRRLPLFSTVYLAVFTTPFPPCPHP